MKIIGITGKRCSGKDTVYAALQGAALNIQRVAFADPLKAECAQALGITLEELEDGKATIFRPLLQWWGTEWRRNRFGEDYWINQMIAKLEGIRNSSLPDGTIVAITDCRFQNEVDMVRALGGKVVKVIRPGLPEDAYGAHVSEAIDGLESDLVLTNDKTLEDFYAEVRKWVPTILT